jgi:type II secretory pathway component GspD/PulD (secretin)
MDYLGGVLWLGWSDVVALRRLKPTWKVTAYSPVDLVVRDPDGRTLSRTVNEIPDATYRELDPDGHGDSYDEITINDPASGQYRLQIVPQSGAPADYPVTIVVEDHGDRQIQALLTAVQSKNYGRVLAKPKVLVNDNEPGLIKTTDTTYVETKSGIPVSSGAAGTQQNFVETTLRYESYEAGITLDIKPHISEGDLLRLDISLIRSDFLLTETPAKPPNTTAREVKTAVMVPDGSTIILGGLLNPHISSNFSAF